jgi:tetratricopeptide (TPR) repeat protein
MNSACDSITQSFQLARRSFSATLRLLLLSAALLMLSGCSVEAKKARYLASAKKYMDAGEYEKAKIEYLNVLDLDPKNGLAKQQLGIIWLENGSAVQALSVLSEALEQAPENPIIRTKLALTCLQLGVPHQAYELALKAFELAPSLDEAVLLLAETAVTKEELSNAKAKLQAIEKPDRAAVHVALSGIASREKDLTTMKKEAELALSLEPDSVVTLLCQANAQMAQNDPAKAGDALKRAAELAPPRSPARIKLVEFKLATGAVPEAKSLLQNMTKEAPDFLPAWRLLAQIAQAEKKYDESIAFLNRVFSRDPSNLEASMMHAQIWLAKGDSKKAIELLEGLRKTYPKVPGVAYRLALAHLQNGDAAKSREVLDETLALNPDYLDAILMLARVELDSGEARAVVNLMRGLLKKRPTMEQAQTLLAQAYRALGRLDDAAEILREQIKKAPKIPVFQIQLGIILRQKGSFAEAREAFGKAREMDPDNPVPMAQLISLDLRDRDFKAAHQKIDEQLQRNPKLPGVFILQGRIFTAEEKWDQAEAAFEKALELNVNESSVYNALISVYLKTGKLSQAVEKMEALLAKNPGNQRALAASARIYLEMKEYTKARDAYGKLLTVKPDFTMALNNLAYLDAVHLKQTDKGYELARKARDLNPSDPSLADTLGWIQHLRGQYSQAMALLTESADKLPDNPEVQYHFGMTAYMMGRPELALPALKMAEASAMEFTGKDEIKQRLAMLEGGGRPEGTISSGELESELQKQPDDILLLTRLAKAYEKEDAPEKAAAALEKTLQLNPKLSSSYVDLARLYAGPLKKPDLAMKDALKARELAPSDPRAAAVLGTVTYAAGDYAKAYGLLRESAESLPDDPGVLFDLAWAAYSHGRVEEARKSMEHLLKVAPASPRLEDATTFLGLTALDPGSKDLAASASQVDEVLQKNPDHVPALMARAAIFAAKNDAKAAADIYSKVLAKLPEFVPAQKWLAAAYAADPATEQKAYDLAAKARRVLPDDPELGRILGGLVYRRKDFPYAVQLLQESAAKRPLDAISSYYLGKALVRTKDFSRAKSELEKSLAAGLPEELAEDAKDTLGEMRLGQADP